MEVTTAWLRKHYKSRPNGGVVAHLCDEVDRLTRALADERKAGERRVEAMRERCAAVAERIGAEAGHGIPAHVRGLVCTRIANELRVLAVAPEGEEG